MHVGLKNARGSALTLALILSAIALVGGLAILDQVINSRKQVVVNKQLINYRIVAHSLVEYTLNAIRQTWCLTPTMIPSGTVCDFNDPLNLERVLLSDNELRALKDLKAANPSGTTPDPDKARLALIDQTVAVGSIMADHPLYQIVNPLLKDKNITGVRFRISRVDNVNEPVRGDETILKVRVDVLTSSLVSWFGGNELYAESKVLVFPRELTSFALIMPNDLYLDGDDSSKPYDSAWSFPVGNGALGLRFESPVFVNGSLHLPKQGATGNNGVVFTDKLVLGGGYAYQSENLYKPATGGGPNDQYMAQMPGIAGIMGGIDLDKERDIGLNYLFNVEPTPTLDLTRFNQCKERARAQVEMNATNKSQMYLALNKATTGNASLSQTSVGLDLGPIDEFREQMHIAQTDVSSSLNMAGVSLTKPTITIGNTSPPVMRATVTIRGYPGGSDGNGVVSYMAEMPRSGAAEFKVGNGKIVLRTAPLTIGSNAQKNHIDVGIDFVDQASWGVADYPVAPGTSGAPKTMNPASIEVHFEAYDLAYTDGVNGRLTDPSFKPTGTIPQYLQYKENGVMFNKSTGIFEAIAGDNGYNATGFGSQTGFYLCPMFTIAGCTGVADSTQLPSYTDWVDFDMSCQGLLPSSDPDVPLNAFGSADWNTSFAKQARFSWGFAPTSMNDFPDGYVPGPFVFDGSNAVPSDGTATSPAGFQVLSIMQECRVKATATLVTGFLTCEKFVIEPRTNPLRIIGTVLAGRVEIDQSAVDAGIRWSNIYQAQAVYELRNAKILNPGLNTGVNCDSTTEPVWSPFLSAKRIQDIYKCMPSYLRAKAPPFSWTTVDPDCGIPAGKGQVQCKGRTRRFTLKEVSRAGTL